MIFIIILIIAVVLGMVYFSQRDIISPAFIVTAVFLISCINLATNISLYGVFLSFETGIVIILGLIFFVLGTLLVSVVNKRVVWNRSLNIQKRNIMLHCLGRKFCVVLIIFNVFSIVFILREVYLLTVTRANFTGSVLSSLSVYAEVSKFQNIDMKLSSISTLMSALCEAEAYVLSYYLADKYARKIKLSIFEILSFITAFLTTFCQGSRGGVFILFTVIISFIISSREVNRFKTLPFKTIFGLLFLISISLVFFQLVGELTGKMWNVSFYEYLSVYLGDPIINLDVAINKGIERTPFWGYLTFFPMIKYFFPKLGFDIPYYNSYARFNEINGHNTGNVYTIFAPFVADYGLIGMLVAMFFLGVICQLFYNLSKSAQSGITTVKVIYSYMAACLGFSFFSSKITENLSVFRIAVFIFAFVFIHLFIYKRFSFRVRYRLGRFIF